MLATTASALEFSLVADRSKPDESAKKSSFAKRDRACDQATLLKVVATIAPAMIAASNALHKLGLGVLARFLPIGDIKCTMSADLDAKELKERVILDSFDMFSPEFDIPQRIETLSGWLREAGAAATFADFTHFGSSSAAMARCVKTNA